MAQVYDKNQIQLYSGNAIEVLNGMPSRIVDAVITDPPYSSGGLHLGDRTKSTQNKYVGNDVVLRRPNFSGDNRDQLSHLTWYNIWLEQCRRIAKPGSPICIFSDWRQLPLTAHAIQSGGWTWRGIVPWNKGESVRPTPGRYRAQCEYVVWGSNEEMSIKRPVPVLPGFYQAVVKPKEKFHQSGKPVQLMREIVRICEPGGTILDPFAGSGTTCLAAKLEGYKAIGIEASEEYLNIAEIRLNDAVQINMPLAQA